jgi:hypothetical protein
MNLDELKEEMLKRPHDFTYWGELDLDVWGFAPIGKHRDSDLLALSNFDTALKELRKVSGKSVQVMHTNHWAVGWYDHIMVRVTAKQTMQKLLDIVHALDDYLVLDEEDLSRREYEQACDAYDRWARYDVAKLAEERGIKILLDEDGYYAPKPEDEETVKGLVAKAILDHNPVEGKYREERLAKLLVEAFLETSKR